MSLISFLQQHEGKKIVFTNGCFDLLHRGHVTYLNEAKKLGDILIVGINADESVRKLKGPERPINSEKDRAFVLENLKAVDFVEIFHEETPKNLIEKIKPNVLVKGGDWPIEKIVGYEFVTSYGGKVFNLTFVEGHSTTNMVEKIRS